MIYFTYQLRQYDIGVLILTDNAQKGIQIPPQAENYTISTICFTECTTNFLPADGITAFAGALHAHLAGRSVKTATTQMLKNWQHVVQQFHHTLFI